jgi:uncharacterized membrane protein YdbT with pleckstrin-like domain
MSIPIPKDMSLTHDEIPIWYGQMSWICWWFWILVAIVFLITRNAFFIFLAVVILVVIWIKVTTTEYFISNKRIYIKRGFISRVMNDIKIEWVTNIFVRQGIFGRILNYGNIGISSPGEVAGAVGFVCISDPIQVKAIIEDTLARYVGKKLN